VLIAAHREVLDDRIAQAENGRPVRLVPSD
jgi:hypothetical protein